jgi:putative MATE family efflux protein
MRFIQLLFLPICNGLLNNNIIPFLKYSEHSIKQSGPLPKILLSNKNETNVISKSFERQVMNDVKKLSLPLLVIWLSDPLLSLIDTTSVGKVSSIVELASLGPATSLCDTGGNILSFISVVTTCQVSRAFVGKDFTKMNKILNDAFVVSFVCGAIVSSLMFNSCGIYILNLFLGNPHASSETSLLIPGAMKYIKIRMVGYIPSLMSSQLQSYALAKRNILFPLKTVGLATLINITADYIFVIKMNLGLVGAAWATVLAQLSTFIYMLSYLVQEKNNYCDHRKIQERIRDVVLFFKRCLGPAVGNIGRAGILIMTSSLCSCCGNISVAAHQVIISWLYLFCPFGEAISQTVMNLLPSYMSSENVTQKTWLFIFAIGKATLILGTINALSAVVPMYFPNLFTTSSEVSTVIHSLGPYLCLALFGHALSCLFEGILVAMGDTKYLATMYFLNMLTISYIYNTFTPSNITILWTIYVSSIITRLIEFFLRIAWRYYCHVKMVNL